MSVALRLRIERAQRGWTQTQLAEQAQCTQANLSLYESGKKIPEPLTLRRLADALDIPLETLLLEAIDEEELLEAQLALQRAIGDLERIAASSRGSVRELLSCTIERLQGESHRLSTGCRDQAA